MINQKNFWSPLVHDDQNHLNNGEAPDSVDISLYAFLCLKKVVSPSLIPTVFCILIPGPSLLHIVDFIWLSKGHSREGRAEHSLKLMSQEKIWLDI